MNGIDVISLVDSKGIVYNGSSISSSIREVFS